MTSGHVLVRLRGGGLGMRSLAFGEVCHPGVGPRAEAELLYVQGLDLKRRLASCDGEFVIWDVGLGGAANAVTVIAAASSLPCTLRMVSFDTTVEPLEFALRHADELGYFGPFVPVLSQLLLNDDLCFRHGAAQFRWSRCLGDFPTMLASPAEREWPRPHAILFDPYSPASNPQMWTLPLFIRLFECLDPVRPCALATYSRSTAVRASLLLAGFHVGAGVGTSSKEETTVAANRVELLTQPLGARWLERARRSRAAEPWTAAPFGGRPVTDASWRRLLEHPQFRSD